MQMFLETGERLTRGSFLLWKKRQKGPLSFDVQVTGDDVNKRLDSRARVIKLAGDFTTQFRHGRSRHSSQYHQHYLIGSDSLRHRPGRQQKT